MERLIELAFAQIKHLRQNGIPESLLSQLLSQQAEMLDNIKCITHDIGLPFMPVIPITLVDANTLMRAMEGYNALLKPADIKNLTETPAKPYYVYQVKVLAEATMGRSSDSARALIKQGYPAYRPLNVAEAVALYMHTDILENYSVWAADSTYQSDSWVPFLENGPQGPRLTWKYALEHQLHKAVTPVCLK